MNGSEPQGLLTFSRTPNFYCAVFFLSLIFLVLLPLGILVSDVWLGAREVGLVADVNALGAEIESLSREVAADTNDIAALQAEVTALAKAEQVFTEDSGQGTLWRPDARWSEMGKARVQDIWRRQGIVQDRQAAAQTLIWQKQADLMRAQARKDQNTYLQDLIRGHTYILYGWLLVGIFAMAFSGLLWGVLVQTRVDAILTRWARRS
jgi:hypothetical protein